MKSNGVKIGVIVVCIAALAAFLLIKQPWKSSTGPGGKPALPSNP